jgi:hypothetical protein
MMKISSKLVFWIVFTRRVQATRPTLAMATSLNLHPSGWRRA